MTHQFVRRVLPLAAAFFGLALFTNTARAQADAAQIAKGDSLFNANRLGACWACHGAKGKGTSTAPKLADKEWLSIDGSLDAIKGVINNGIPKPKKTKTPMPPMGGGKLTPEEVDAIAAYVFKLSH